ncbi:MAG TPA: xanthine dehydrogenase family protein subunit M [Acidimicrobiia bacterium]
MSIFDYERPGTLAEASEALRRDDAVALAGGTDLLVAIRHRAISPLAVVDLKSVAEIDDDIIRDGDRLTIGGGVVMSRLVHDEHVNRCFPALAAAASVVGSVQVRNRATLAGNLCNASPAADTAPPLLAFASSVTISDGDASRTVPVAAFFLGPGVTVLERGEVVQSIEVPIPRSNSGSAFARVTRRRGVDLATVSLACVVDASGHVRFGLGAVGPTPLVAESTVDELASDDGIDRFLAVTSPITDVRAGADYRRAMLRVHTRRALQAALGEMETAS